MALSESAGQRPALLRPAQGRDDRAYWHELFGSLEVVHFFLVTARCGCFMQAARSLDVKPTLLRKTLARLEERLGLHLFVHEGNALSLTRELVPQAPLSLNPMRITVDGVPIDDPQRNSADIQRCTDVAFAGADIRFGYDNLRSSPRLSVMAQPARVALDLDRIVNEDGVAFSSSNHSWLDPDGSMTLRDGALVPGLAGPLGGTLVRRLTDPTTGIVLDTWIDADRVWHRPTPPSGPAGGGR